MALDISQTVAVLQAALLREMGDEVELIFLFGSRLTGGTHSYSDQDLLWVPTHPSAWRCFTVLVEDTLVDLFPVRWEWLERLADFDDVRGTLLLNYEIVYQRTPEAAARLASLADRLRSLHAPAARPAMIRKALKLFQETGYPYYLLRHEADRGQLLACVQVSQRILQRVFHVLAVCNQRSVDTRKLDQMLALPKVPVGFAGLIDRVLYAHTPETLVAATTGLLDGTRELLLTEQREVLRRESSYPQALDAAYPELRGDIQHVLLACERQDMLMLKDKLMSLYHELLVHMALAETGVEYSEFNSLADYEQALTPLGFPALWPYVFAQDFSGLYREVIRFDQRLQQFLVEQGVRLNCYATLDDLRRELGVADPL